MSQSDEVKVDDRASNTLEHFTELEQVLQMIDSIKPIDNGSFEREFEQFTEVLTRYQEQPHLLDPHIDVLLGRLLAKIRDQSLADTFRHAAFKYLYIISKVRTFKVLVKFLPHELSDLELALKLLERQNPAEYATWETRYILLLWMSILVLNPFHMSRLDAYEQSDTPAAEPHLNHCTTQKTKMERIFDLCKLYSSSNDTCSDVTAYLAAKYLVRTDVKDVYLERYFDWVIEQHQANTVNVKYGQLAAIAAILKHGKREDLLPYAGKILHWIISCQYKDSNDFLKYKTYIKIIQRIGLIYLKPRIASWRYKRGTRSLAANLNQTVNTQSKVETNSVNEAGDNDEVAVPDAIEDIIDELLQALRSGGNDIRWSAAKGIGRVTNRLPKELGDEVVGSVIDILMPLEPNEAWHGACLALAELAKRGLLLPYRLHELVPLLMQALFYDEMKGYMSVGQHIRDSACYMCWAFARAYNPQDLHPFVQQISSGLLTVAVFDREINCRRAASAAFQESVGRLGNFPYGIEISTNTDFYAVGLRQQTYLIISDYIAQYEEYQRPLIDHLVQRKVNHWDIAIREQTAKALHKLTYRAPEYMAAVVLPVLFSKTDNIELNMRHGSILAIGEIVLALRQLEQHNDDGSRRNFLSNQTITNLNELLGKIVERDLFRGLSGDIMKQCSLSYIRNCSLARLDLTSSCLDSFQHIIDLCLINKGTTVRQAAIAAFGELCRAYYNNAGQQQRDRNDVIVSKYLNGANDDLEEPTRMGYLGALGALSKSMILPNFEAILDSLIKHSLTPLQAVIGGELSAKDHENIQTHTWSEARKESVIALSALVATIGYDDHQNVSFLEPIYFNKVFECLLKALGEYTLDNRGDIGAWVREAAMTALYDLLTTCPSELLTPNRVHQVLVGFMQQAVEKIDRTRGLAGRLCCQFVNLKPPILYIKDHAALLEIFPEDVNSVLWLFADQTFPLFCKLLALPDYSKRVLLGLTASIGQLTESLIKYASNSLFQFLRSNPDAVPRLCFETVEIFQENLLNERITYPMLSFLDILIGSGVISSVLHDESNSFAEDVYRLVTEEIKGFKKLYKLTSSINVYCQLLQVPRLSKRILSKMSVFLGLTHVHVRKTTATKLYESIALHGDVTEIPEDNLDEILSLLSETDWGLPLVEVRPIRNEICTLIGIKHPMSSKASSSLPMVNPRL